MKKCYYYIRPIYIKSNNLVLSVNTNWLLLLFLKSISLAERRSHILFENVVTLLIYRTIVFVKFNQYQNKVTVPVFKELIRLTMGSQIIIIGILLPTTVGGIKKNTKCFTFFNTPIQKN